jgi:hypothetical protein
MSRFSGKAHWIVSAIVLTSSSLRVSHIENEPRLRRKTEDQKAGTRLREENRHAAARLCGRSSFIGHPGANFYRRAAKIRMPLRGGLLLMSF